MPEYSYKCDGCGKSFTLTLGIKEHAEAKVKCPKCASRKVTQKISAFHAVTSKKS